MNKPVHSKTTLGAIRIQNEVSVTVGICAYNEEYNIKNLLSSMLEQKQNNFELKEIIVVSDGSTDNTITQVNKIHDKRIKLIKNKKRIGLPLSQNKLLNNFTGDILVLVDADIFIKDKMFLYKMITPILKDSKVGLVSTKVLPLHSESFFESIINFSIEYKTHIFNQLNHGNNIFLCHGRARTLSKEFILHLRWKSVLIEDAFSYLTCLNNGFKFVYQPATEVLYRSPNNLFDHQKQSSRFNLGKKELEKYFSSHLIHNNFQIPKLVLLKSSFLYFWKNPFLFIAYLVISILVTIIPKNPDKKWSMAESTKYLNVAGRLK